MSAETIQWLNNNTLIGNVLERDIWTSGWGRFKDDRFSAWWQSDDFKGAYDGPIPIGDVESRLFFWTPQECTINVEIQVDDVELADGLDAQGNPVLYVPDPGRKAIVRPDTETVLGIFGADSYQVHEYNRWLVENVGTILDVSAGDLGISSAGLLRGGGVAYVTIEPPDTIRLGDYEGLRPAIVACTSLDGTKATTYKRVLMRPICDNSLDATLVGEDGKFKVRHSSKSLSRIGDAREAIGVFFETLDDDVRFFEACANTAMPDEAFDRIVEALVPAPDPERDVKGNVTNQRAITNANSRQADLWRIYGMDPRVGSHIHGTLAGGWMAVNTWSQHERPRTVNQVERTMTGLIGGGFADADREFWDIVRELEVVKVPVLTK